MRICYLGPSERRAMLQEYASPGMAIEARQAGSRAAPESVYDEYMEIPAHLEAVRQAQSDGHDAVIVGCFGDPGIDAAREIAAIPVVGLGETSLTIAAMLGTRFGIVTPLRRLLPASLRQVRALGLDRRLAHIEPAEIPILAIREEPDDALRLMLPAARKCCEQGAESLALACGSMSAYAQRLQEQLGIPVVHGLKVCVRFAELPVSSN
ncbi:MAG: hypothetical protein FJW35_01585 [Acidobacteria bacterium]|nr:hypothetical protein [Acidobacteriota bacterium]